MKWIRNPHISRQRGIALIAVLWTVLLLSLIATNFLTQTRTDARITRNLIDNAEAESAADAGIYRAVLALLEPDESKRWKADGRIYEFEFGGAEILISIQDEAGMVDLNIAPDESLRRLFVSIGIEEQKAAILVDTIADFRDKDDLVRLNGAEDKDYLAAGLPYGAKDAPFDAVEELQQVLGMTSALYRAIAPSLTVYSRRGGINPVNAPRQVLLSLPGVDADLAETLLASRADEVDPFDLGDLPEIAWRDGAIIPGTSGIYTVRAEARTASNAVSVQEAVIRVRIPVDPNRPFTIYSWKRGNRTARDSDNITNHQYETGMSR